MAHNKKFEEYMVVQNVCPPQATTSTSLDVTSVNAFGWDRATFIFVLGKPSGDTANISTGWGIWQAATSGATYARMTSASGAQITTGQGSNANFVVDVNVDQSYPWLRFSGFNVSTAWPNAVVCILRSPSDAPPTSLSADIITPD
jgi:hypothetical protein